MVTDAVAALLRVSAEPDTCVQEYVIDPVPLAEALSEKTFDVSTTIGPSPSVIDAATAAVPPEPTTTVIMSEAFEPRESVASTRRDNVIFVAGAVNERVAVFVATPEMTEGFGPDDCDHAYVTAPTPVAAAVRDTAPPCATVTDDPPNKLPLIATPVSAVVV
jgi:hypothetical protein